MKEKIDWNANEVIVVASSTYDCNEAEQRAIKTIIGNTVTITEPFLYSDFAANETFGGKSIAMSAEVGLLSRNIKIMGDISST